MMAKLERLRARYDHFGVALAWPPDKGPADWCTQKRQLRRDMISENASVVAATSLDSPVAKTIASSLDRNVGRPFDSIFDSDDRDTQSLSLSWQAGRSEQNRLEIHFRWPHSLSGHPSTTETHPTFRNGTGQILSS
jgi:hypothetical protein